MFLQGKKQRVISNAMKMNRKCFLFRLLELLSISWGRVLLSLKKIHAVEYIKGNIAKT